MLTFVNNILWELFVQDHNWDALIFTQQWPINTCYHWREDSPDQEWTLPEDRVSLKWSSLGCFELLWSWNVKYSRSPRCCQKVFPANSWYTQVSISTHGIDKIIDRINVFDYMSCSPSIRFFFFTGNFECRVYSHSPEKSSTVRTQTKIAAAFMNFVCVARAQEIAENWNWFPLNFY